MSSIPQDTKSMKKGLILTLAALVGLVLLVGVGCSKKDDGPKVAPNPNVKIEQPVAPKLPPPPKQ